jgi:hypothetical protein
MAWVLLAMAWMTGHARYDVVRRDALEPARSMRCTAAGRLKAGATYYSQA